MPSLNLSSQYLNFYICPDCRHEWYDIWDCGVDTNCDHCGARDISPEQSVQLPQGGIDELAVWQGEFQPLVDDVGNSPVDEEQP